MKENKQAKGQGQNGPKLDLEIADLSPRERQLVDFVASQGDRVVLLAEMAASLWRSKPAAQANSWCRNSLRRLVRAGFIEKVGPGAYVADRSKVRNNAKRTA